MDKRYLDGLRKQLEFYKSLGEKTFSQLSFTEMSTEVGEEANSISIIVKHLHGNMLSRFSDFLTSDGEKQWRNRDDEFVDSVSSRDDLLELWNIGWKCVFEALDSISSIEQIVYIRNQAHTVYEAFNRQVAHYAYHVGQIVFIGKCFKGSDWQSLSIPRNKSKSYNKEKFSKGKNDGHYTDDFIEK